MPSAPNLLYVRYAHEDMQEQFDVEAEKSIRIHAHSKFKIGGLSIRCQTRRGKKD